MQRTFKYCGADHIDTQVTNHFAPGSESSRERNGQGANWPGSEKAVNQVSQHSIFVRWSNAGELYHLFADSDSIPLPRWRIPHTQWRHRVLHLWSAALWPQAARARRSLHHNLAAMTVLCRHFQAMKWKSIIYHVPLHRCHWTNDIYCIYCILRILLSCYRPSRLHIISISYINKYTYQFSVILTNAKVSSR